MSERIVACFRAKVQDVRTGSESARLDSVRFFMKRAEALGAKLCTWSSLSFSFAFLAEELEELIEFVLGEDARAHGAMFCVGMSQGEVASLLEVRGLVELGSGTPVLRAQVLARMARAGEVLVDSEMEALHRGDLLTCGSRLTTEQAQRIRGYVLDVRQPWRADAERAIEQLREPGLVGKAQQMAQTQIAPGTLVILRAASGLGGSRMLRALAEASGGGGKLLVQPAGVGIEPLGALRRALARDAGRSGIRGLPPEERKVLDRILSGAGSDIASVARVLESWMASSPDRKPGTVLIEDAGDVDSDSLDAIGTALLGATQPFRCIARLDAAAPLPAGLASPPPGPELELRALTAPEAEQMAVGWFGASAAETWVASWARKGGGVPLAIAEAIAEGLSSGALAWDTQGVHSRLRSAGRGGPLSARDWIARRIAFVPSEPRSLLFAVAVLGGDTSLAHAEALLRAAADAPLEVARAAEFLTRRRWLLQPQPGWVALPSRTHTQTVLESVPETRRVAWHRAASLVIESRDGPLARATAASHASLANDHRRAARLALEASQAAADALLQATSKDLLSMARSEDPAFTQGIESTWPTSIESEIPLAHMAASNFAAQLAARSPQRDYRSSYPPVEGSVEPSVPEASQPQGQQQPRKPPASLPPKPAPPRIPRPPAVPLGLRAQAPPAPPAVAPGRPLPAPGGATPKPQPAQQAAPSDAPPAREPMRSREPSLMMDSMEALTETLGADHPRPQTPPPSIRARAPDHSLIELSDDDLVEHTATAADRSRVGAINLMAANLPIVAREALNAGDPAILDRWAQNEPMTSERERMVNRLRAIVVLGHGDKTEALRVLREACQQGTSSGPLERSRSHLAYGIGLAQTGRALEALVEGLEALARAREAASPKAERACACFLEKIYAGTGHVDTSGAWAEIVGQDR
jgi:hypothetical protein